MPPLSFVISAVLRLSSFALAAALFCGGCRTPMPPGPATHGLRLGPFFETASDDSGSRLVALRPFFSYETAAETASYPDSQAQPCVSTRSETDLLWPLAIHSRRDDHYYWRALLFYGTGVDDDLTSPNDPWRFRLFPFIYAGRTQEGEDYGAFFPFYGTIREFLVFHDTSFFLFPIYAEGRSPTGVEMRTVLWPFYLTRHGERIDQLRLWPFYGTAERRNLHTTSRSRFVLWPIWSDASSKGEIEGSGFVLFPIFGHSRHVREKRGVEESWSVIPPLFLYARGDDGYRKLFAPWPFVRLLDNDGIRERHIWPLWGRTERWPVEVLHPAVPGGVAQTCAKSRPDPDLSRSYFLWPFFSRTESGHSGVRRSVLHAPLPFFFRREEEVLHPAVPGEGAQTSAKSSFTRLWPLFSFRRTGVAGRKEPGASPYPDSQAPSCVTAQPCVTAPSCVSLRIPELSLWSKSEQVERNWAPLWSLYTYRKKSTGAYCNDLLWGLLSWGRNDDGGAIFSLLWIPFAR